MPLRQPLDTGCASGSRLSLFLFLLPGGVEWVGVPHEGGGGGDRPAIVVKKKVRRRFQTQSTRPRPSPEVLPAGAGWGSGRARCMAVVDLLVPTSPPPRRGSGRLLSTEVGLVIHRAFTIWSRIRRTRRACRPAGRAGASDAGPDRRRAARPPAAPPTRRRAARGSRSVGRAPLLALAAYKWGTLKGALRPHCRPVAIAPTGEPGPAMLT